MSASTVSITAANPSSARRRPVIAADKKTSNMELLVIDATVSPSDGDGKAATSAGNARRLSHHSVRGEAVLERSAKDLVLPKKAAAGGVAAGSGGGNSNGMTRRVRKWWDTVLSIFMEYGGLLLVLVGFFYLNWNLALKSSDAIGDGVGLSNFEGRIPDVEGLLKMTQVQVEVMNRKMEDEVGGLMKEMNEKSAILESGIKKLEAKSEGLERYLNELMTEDWLSREEFHKIFEGLKKNAKGSGYEGGSWDEIREFAKRVIEKEIEKHAADGLGRVDYALYSGGGRVVRHSEAYHFGKGNWFLSARNGVHPNADKMLKPSFGQPGECFPLKGSNGFVQIKLRTAIIPEAVTLEHVSKSVAFDRSSAPKDCRVSGWLQGPNTDPLDTVKMFLLAEFTYDLEKSNAQTFNVLNSADSGLIDTVRLDFTSNHGSSHTSIYRLRVHGQEPDPTQFL